MVHPVRFVPPLLLAAACATTAPRLSMPEQPLDMPAPEEAPEIRADAPRPVPYPGLEVAYVAGADGEVYLYRGGYYTYFDRHWFRAARLDGPWTYVEMKYVPGDLFRVRGHLPPGLRILR